MQITTHHPSSTSYAPQKVGAQAERAASQSKKTSRPMSPAAFLAAGRRRTAPSTSHRWPKDLMRCWAEGIPPHVQKVDSVDAVKAGLIHKGFQMG